MQSSEMCLGPSPIFLNSPTPISVKQKNSAKQICTKQNKWALRSYNDKTTQTKNQSNGLPNLISEELLNSLSEL